MKTLSPKLLQVLHFLVTFEARKCASRCGWACEAWFLPVFSRFVMWCCEQRPLSHLRLTDFGLAKMGLRLDLDFFQVTWSHQITWFHQASSIKHIKTSINCEAKISHPPCVALLSIYHQRSIASDRIFYLLPKKIFENGWNNMKTPPVEVFKRQSYACELDWLAAQNLHIWN